MIVCEYSPSLFVYSIAIVSIRNGMNARLKAVEEVMHEQTLLSPIKKAKHGHYAPIKLTVETQKSQRGFGAFYPKVRD